MERPYILHLFTPGAQASPFDVNMAVDAGWQVVVPYCHVEVDGVTALTQDTIFSRGPKAAARTGIFIGGRDTSVASDMLDRAKAAMFKPFVVALMADPSGAYTTAAAMVASVESALRRQGRDLNGRRVVVFGGTGPVGRIAGVLAARQGADVRLASRAAEAADEAARVTGERFGVTMRGLGSADRAGLRAALADVDVVLACAATGVQVVSAELLGAAPRLAVAADVNAVPPEGIAGVGAMDDAKPLVGTAAVGIGALAIGNVKYQTQHRMMVQMREADRPPVLSFFEAFAAARAVLEEKAAGAQHAAGTGDAATGGDGGAAT